MKKVSVIVPAYNVENYIDRCLKSLVNQTLKDIEIIVINDESTDNTLNIIKEYQKKYDNVVVFNNKNHGIGYTRNFGIQKATGKYIAFIDSDDFIDETMFEKLYKYSETNKLDMCVCDFYKYFEQTKKQSLEIIPDFNITNLESSPNILLDINYSPWNKLYKKELVKDLYFEQDLKYEDVPFVIEAISKSKRIGKYNECLNYYVIRGNSETTSMDKRVFDILKVLNIINNTLTSLDYYDEIKDYVEYVNIRTLFRYTLQQRNQKDKSLKRKFINDAFNYLNNNFPNWKQNKIFKQRNIIKRKIESSKILTNLYCKLP